MCWEKNIEKIVKKGSSKSNPEHHHILKASSFSVTKAETIFVSNVEKCKSEFSNLTSTKWFLSDGESDGKTKNLKYKCCVMFQDKTCSSFAQGSISYGKSALIDPLRSEKQCPKYAYTVV